MDETSAETSASTTNDTDNKSKTDTGDHKSSKEVSSGLSENSIDGETKSDVKLTKKSNRLNQTYLRKAMAKMEK